MYKEIPSLPGYSVSNDGSVKGKSGKVLKQTKNRYGYLTIKPPKSSSKTVHRLVAEVYIPNPNNLPFINHIDGDKSNNKAENLEWCTKQYNTEYSVSKHYILKNVETGERFKVFNLSKWGKSKGIRSSHLIGTYTKGFNHHKGYRVIEVLEKS